MLAEWLPAELYHEPSGRTRTKPLILKADIGSDAGLIWSLMLCAAAFICGILARRWKNRSVQVTYML